MPELVVLIIIVAAGVIALVWFILRLTRPLAQAGATFMLALKEARFAEAYALLTPELQAQVSIRAFQQRFADPPLTEWRFQKRSRGGRVGLLRGNALFGDKRLRLELRLMKQDGQWKISAVDVG